ncbi:MAG: hypothetical protein IH971_04710 [Candidatus Marinimicrobia bacterium]|nr:hypothetical protein [Candidatus Neomarinimicrobiota bacterium]
MALTYNKLFWGTVLTGLEALLEAELSPGVRVVISGVHQKHGTARVRLAPLSTSWLTRESTGETRSYTVELTYSADLKPGRKGLQHLLDMQARLNRLVTNNTVRAPGGAYAWHDARLVHTEINPPRQAGEPEQGGLLRSTFLCTVTEPIS